MLLSVLVDIEQYTAWLVPNLTDQQPQATARRVS